MQGECRMEKIKSKIKEFLRGWFIDTDGSIDDFLIGELITCLCWLVTLIYIIYESFIKGGYYK